MNIGKNQFLYAIILILSLVAAFCLFNANKIDFKDIGVTLLTLFTTMIGATLAFRLNESHEESAEESRKITALNVALFTMARQLNAVNQIHNDLNQRTNDIDLAFNMPALKPPSYNDLQIKIDDIDFLLHKYPNLLFKLTIEQERFEQAIDSLNIRNNFHITEVQPTIAALQLNNKRFTTEQIKDAIGERIFFGAMTAAKNLKEHISSTALSSHSAMTELRDAAKSLYPRAKFITFDKT